MPSRWSHSPPPPLAPSLRLPIALEPWGHSRVEGWMARMCGSRRSDGVAELCGTCGPEANATPQLVVPLGRRNSGQGMWSQPTVMG